MSHSYISPHKDIRHRIHLCNWHCVVVVVCIRVCVCVVCVCCSYLVGRYNLVGSKPQVFMNGGWRKDMSHTHRLGWNTGS